MKLIPQIILMAPQPGQSPLVSFLPLVAVVIVFYFFMIRPQMKKQKEQGKFREGIQKGDKVITIGGVHGKIVEVGDKTFIIEGEGGHRQKIEKSAVSLESTLATYKKD